MTNEEQLKIIIATMLQEKFDEGFIGGLELMKNKIVQWRHMRFVLEFNKK